MQDQPNKSLLDRLSNVVGKKNKVGKLISGYQKLREANYISHHFSEYLTPLVANCDALREEVFHIRHTVYCEELKFEPERENKQESDPFDAYSMHCLIKHIGTGNHAGTVRIVRPMNPGELLPIEKYCMDSITDKELNPANFERHQVCEISRLAVPKAFRRRNIDQHSGAATGVINTTTYSETELRCFPFIAVGLYFAAAAMVIQQGISHTYVMMEPRLARSMGFIGIQFQQIGPVVDYHGQRAPYYINPDLLYENLSPGFQIMLEHIQASLSSNKLA